MRELTAKRSELLKKNKAIEEREMKLSQNLRPKLQQAIDHQKYLYENFNRIKQDTEFLPMIFRAEAAVRTRALDA